MTDTAPVGAGFWVLATAIVLGSLGTVLFRNMVHAALSLAFVLLMVAGVYLHLGADLLAGFQVLIYVGAVVTLVLIAIMLIQNLASRRVIQTNRRWGPAALLSAALAGLLLYVFSDARWPTAEAAIPLRSAEWAWQQRLHDLCLALLDTYLLPFEIASVLLLVALVGSIVIAQQTESRSVESDTKEDQP